jgi:hypothetical protein
VSLYAEWDCWGEDIQSRVFAGPSMAQCLDRASVFVARLELASSGTGFRSLHTQWDAEEGYSLVVYYDQNELPEDFQTEPFRISDD